MLKTLSSVTLAAMIFLGVGYAQKQTLTVSPISGTSVTDGKQMFTNYCAPCHGVNGRGDGPVASSLKTQPADLALLTRTHGGKFPYSHVMSILEFGTEKAAHGTETMPVWGPLFSQVDPLTTSNADRTLRFNNLARYIESFQVK